MKALVLCSAAAAATFAAGIAVAQPAPVAPAQPGVAKTQTRADVQSHVARMFARLDTNRDGVIVRQEVDAARAKFAGRMQERGEQRGPNGDRSKAFDRIDANDDGNISRQEFATAPRGPGKGEHSAGMRGGFAGRIFDMADANKDGRVTLAEAQQAALQHFDRADLNRDGTLTPDERRQSRQQMRAQPRG